ncbi:MAG TPA: DUF5602 domain-containing protein [Gemmatimonadaceae bacterium]
MHRRSIERADARRRSLRGAAVASATVIASLAVLAAWSGASHRTEHARAHVDYGPALRVGNGTARTYVTIDRQGAPVEVGVALDERALDGLPAPKPGHEAAHMDMHAYLLSLPTGNPTPYRFVELNWNPAGHEPPGIYDKPHFDFHFWTVPVADRNAIDPSDARYADKAASLPESSYVLPGWVPGSVLGKITPGAAAVPRMGLHWLNPASPELPPSLRTFTRTYIMGSWDGRVVFHEPMITRAHILSKKAAADSAGRDEVIAVPVAARHGVAGYYPTAYRIAWDATAKVYRVALTGLTRHE